MNRVPSTWTQIFVKHVCHDLDDKQWQDLSIIGMGGCVYPNGIFSFVRNPLWFGGPHGEPYLHVPKW